jgi:hypothetical protein
VVRAHRRLVVALGVALLLCVLLGVGADPGSGTATNLHPISDVASQVVGEHHAKPLPRSGAVVVALVLLAVTAAALLLLPQVAPTRCLPVGGPEGGAVSGDQVCGRRGAPRRGPPAPALA